ncbi:MAG: siderophore-interacting protein [Antricoccus sp.]
MSRPETTYLAEVHSNLMITPHMRRIVFGGEGLRAFTSSGIADEWIRLFFPTVANEPAVLPVSQGKGWSFPDGVPREGRWYSIRDHAIETHQLTIDIVDHPGGIATSWAATAKTGDQIAISGPDGRYGPDAPTDWELVVADMTGLPAALRILRELPAGKPALALLEVPDAYDEQTIISAGQVATTWILNPAHGSGASLLPQAVRATSWLRGRPYVWMSAEAAATRDMRTYIRRERRVPNGCADIVGYWSLTRATR